MKSKILILEWLLIVAIFFCGCAAFVYKIDPYFHYHQPDTDRYFYVLDNQRSQNDGISKHFDYDALITGTSMAENFKTSEFDEIFGVDSIKVPYSGGSYKEINDNLTIALKSNPKLKTIIRCLDMGRFFDSADVMRSDLGEYPTYLYDSNPFNDVKYLLNKDIIFSRSYRMAKENDDPNALRGITSFDDYSRWQYGYSFGIDTVLPGRNMTVEQGVSVHLTESERKTIEENITKNVTSLADQYPDVDFYYFFSPYSIVWWAPLVNNGIMDRQIEAERYIIELILEHSNIHLYSFNNKTEITTDLNNYKDDRHYGQWVNTLMLKWMHDREGILTKDNYEKYLEDEYEFYSEYDYANANSQKDYEADFYAAAILNQEIRGEVPEDLLHSDVSHIHLNGALLQDGLYENQEGILCTGSLSREAGNDISISDYVRNFEYIGAEIDIDDIGSHRFLEFYGKKESGHGQPFVFVYDSNNNMVASLTKNYGEIDNEWHQYVIELPEMTGSVTVILNGGYIDISGDKDSTYSFCNLILY